MVCVRTKDEHENNRFISVANVTKYLLTRHDHLCEAGTVSDCRLQCQGQKMRRWFPDKSGCPCTLAATKQPLWQVKLAPSVTAGYGFTGKIAQMLPERSGCHPMLTAQQPEFKEQQLQNIQRLVWEVMPAVLFAIYAVQMAWMHLSGCAQMQ